MRATPVRPELVEGLVASLGQGFDSLSPVGSSRTRRKPLLLRPLAKPLLFVVCLLPFAWLLYGAVSSVYGVNTLGANPAETLMRATGDWTLRFLCITLAVTPLRQWFKQPALALTWLKRSIKALGAARWLALHRVVYGIALLAILLFFCMREE